jgi:hypothetical protein
MRAVKMHATMTPPPPDGGRGPHDFDVDRDRLAGERDRGE